MKPVFTKLESDFLRSLEESAKSKIVYHYAVSLGFDSYMASDVSKCRRPSEIARRLGVEFDENAKPPIEYIYTTRCKEIIRFMVFALGKQKMHAILILSSYITNVEVTNNGALIFREYRTVDIDLDRLALICHLLHADYEFEQLLDILEVENKEDIVMVSPKLYGKIPRDRTVKEYVTNNSDIIVALVDNKSVYRHKLEIQEDWKDAITVEKIYKNLVKYVNKK